MALQREGWYVRDGHHLLLSPSSIFRPITSDGQPPLPLAFLSAADTVVAHTLHCSSCKTAALASADFTHHNETLRAVHCMRFKLSQCKTGQTRGIAQAAEAYMQG